MTQLDLIGTILFIERLARSGSVRDVSKCNIVPGSPICEAGRDVSGGPRFGRWFKEDAAS